MNESLTNLERLVSKFYDELQDRGYGARSYYGYRAASNHLLKWCRENSITVYNEEVGEKFRQYLQEKFTDKLHTRRLKMDMRLTRLLNSVQNETQFEYRTPLIPRPIRKENETSITLFLKYCGEILQSSKATISQKRMILSRYDSYLEKNGNLSITNINCDIIENFIDVSCTPLNRKVYKIALRQFYKYLYDQQLCKDDLSKRILKEPNVMHERPLPTTYSEQEIKRLIGAIDRNNKIGKRDYLILLFAAEYGMRASDIIRLSFSNINWKENRISMIQQKTNRLVSFPLLASVGNAIIDYLQHGRPETDNQTIVVRHDALFEGYPMTSGGIYSIVSKAMRNANIKDWQYKRHGPHALRHSLATNLMKQDVAIPIISSILGHTCIESTKKYIGIDVEKLRKCSLEIPAINSPHYYFHKLN